MKSRWLVGVVLSLFPWGVASAATFTVDSIADLTDVDPGNGVCATAAGTCTLRAAIEESNLTATLDTIAFAIPGPGVHTIPTATLPAITQPIVIDGFTQPGSQPNTIAVGGLNAYLTIELSGGLAIRAGNATVRGIVSNGGAIVFEAGPGTPAQSVVEGCYVGTDAGGTQDASGAEGISFVRTAGAVRVGGLLAARRTLVSGHGGGGVVFVCDPGGPGCSTSIEIQGNLIGTDAAGTAAIPNEVGIRMLNPPEAVIGGRTSQARNVISGNVVAGIQITGRNGASPAVRIEGNVIGVDSGGVGMLPNGIGISAGPACVAPDPSCPPSPAVIVGGSWQATNVLSWNSGPAIRATGGELTVTENVITLNGGDGVSIDVPGLPLSGEVAGNTIIANGGAAVAFRVGSAFVTVQRNRIERNLRGGVSMAALTSNHTGFVRIRDNSFTRNEGLAIDLGDDGVTPNDPLDQDGGPNGRMNYPALASACDGPGGFTLSGLLHGEPASAVVLEFYYAAECEPSGHGEGLQVYASQSVTTDAGGDAPFVATFATFGSSGFVTATATDALGRTSEFSACAPVLVVPPPAQTVTGPAGVCEGTTLRLSATPGAGEYQWLLNGTPIAGATGLVYTRPLAQSSDSGSYSVRATSCGVSATSAPHPVTVAACAASPVRLDVDTSAAAGTTSDLNGVLDPTETALVAPRYRNSTALALALDGAATFTGPPHAVYALPDANASYGTVGPGQMTDCVAATGDCYRAFVLGSRPQQHWDAAFVETTTAGDPVRHWPVHIGETFSDVPRPNLFYRFVETLVHTAVTSGCSNSGYCPLSPSRREQMAVFVLVANEGAGYRPPDCNPSAPRFADVPASSGFCRWIEELARRQVVSGCGGSNYCPSASVSREQMSVFVLATREAPGYVPPACVAGAERFADVPASSGFCRWIEELARRGVVSGCGNGRYCPADAVTRGQMSVFLTVTFGLLLYGP